MSETRNLRIQFSQFGITMFIFIWFLGRLYHANYWGTRICTMYCMCIFKNLHHRKICTIAVFIHSRILKNEILARVFHFCVKMHFHHLPVLGRLYCFFFNPIQFALDSFKNQCFPNFYSSLNGLGIEWKFYFFTS